MGFISTATTTTLTAKLTPIGRQRIVSNNNSLITTFGLGDSDANYNVPLILTTGEVPTSSGDIGSDYSSSNSTAKMVGLRSQLILNQSGTLRKSVEPQSITITSEQITLSSTTISGSNISYDVIDRTNYYTDKMVNLFYSFGLPLSSTDDANYTGVTSTNGGYSNTSYSGLAQTKIIAIGVKDSTYGECLDGKTIKLSFPTSAGTYTIYSTFQSSSTSLKTQDANIQETSNVINLGENVAFLFSDTIKRPNGDSTLSWATGYDTIKPFSQNSKQLFNYQTNSNIAASGDTIVGVAYLDKGFLVLTHPAIVSAYTATATTATTISFASVSTAVYQNVTCIAGRGEFGVSTNPTFSSVNTPRISELALYDNLGNIIALAKSDRHITKNINEFTAFNVKIQL